MSASGTSETNCGARTSILLVPLIGFLVSRLAIRQLPAANVLTACFSAAMAAQPLRPSSQLGVRYTKGAGAYEKEQKSGARQPFLGVQPSRQWQASGRELQP